MNQRFRKLAGRSTAALATGAAVLGLPAAAVAGFGSASTNPGNSVQAASLVAALTPQAAQSGPKSTVQVSSSVPPTQAPGAEYRVLDTTTAKTICTNKTADSQPSCSEANLSTKKTYTFVVETYLPGTTWTKDATPVTSSG